jgi:hypothetical protein
MEKAANTAPKITIADISTVRLPADFEVELELAGALPVAVPLPLPLAVELAPVPLAVVVPVGILKYADAFVLLTFA